MVFPFVMMLSMLESQFIQCYRCGLGIIDVTAISDIAFKSSQVVEGGSCDRNIFLKHSMFMIIHTHNIAKTLTGRGKPLLGLVIGFTKELLCSKLIPQ